MVKKILCMISVLIFSMVILTTTVFAEVDHYRVTASSGLRLRESPINGNIITVMTYGQTIDITGYDGEWAFGYTAGKYSGWCSTKYLEKIDIDTYQQPSQETGNLEYIGSFRITGYTPSPYENGGTGLTCTGIKASTVVGQCIATDLKVIPLGTKVYIENIGYRTVMDCGVRGKVIDVLCSTTSQCYSITGYQNVYIVR